MRRLTTPIHRYTLPIPVSECKRVLITYSQGSRKILDKTLNDATVEGGNTLIVRLTQEETAMFSASHEVSIQVRVLTNSDDAFASNIMRLSATDVLNDEVLT